MSKSARPLVSIRRPDSIAPILSGLLDQRLMEDDMTTPKAPTLDQLIRDADAAVKQTLDYLSPTGRGARSTAKIDRWGVRETAAHLLYWHRATAQSAQAVGRGETPRQFTVPVDDTNEEAVAECAGLSLADIVAQLRKAHLELVQAIRKLPNSDAPLMRRFDGAAPTAKDRLRTIAHHWAGHLEAMQAAGKLSHPGDSGR
jgi:hypothetical protein